MVARRAGRSPIGRARGQLLAVARQHEQAVVDPEAEAHAGDEVDREDRQRRHRRVDQPQTKEGEHDGKAADQQRQRGGDKSAEHPEGQQQQDREGQHLRALQVGRGGFVDLLEGDVAAAEAHACSRSRAHTSDGSGGGFAVGERGQHEREPPVAGDQLGQVAGRAGRPVVESALEARLARQQRGHPGAPALGGRLAANVAGARHQRNEAVVGGLPGRAFHRSQLLLVLRRGVLEVGVFAFEDPDHRGAERRCQQEGDTGDEEDAPGARGGGEGQSLDHGRYISDC